MPHHSMQPRYHREQLAADRLADNAKRATLAVRLATALLKLLAFLTHLAH